MELQKSVKPYKLNEVNFPLSDDRNKKLLQEYGIRTYNALITETISFKELYRLAYNVVKFEKILLSDKATLSIGKNIFDFFVIKEAYSRRLQSILKFLENIKIAEKPIKKYSRLTKENVAMRDFVQRRIGLNKEELIHIISVYWDNILFFLHVIENIEIGELIKKEPHIKMFGSSIKLSDSVRKNIQSLKKENLSLIEKYNKKWNVLPTFRETVTINDKAINNTSKKISEYLTMVDKKSIHATATFYEQLIAKDAFDRRVLFIRKLNNALHLQDLSKKNISKYINEDDIINIYDKYVRASNAYIEAVRVMSEAGDQKWFESMKDSMCNYESFSDFYVGDYEYKKACIRLVMTSDLTDSAPTIYDVAANVDIDDTDDRGTAKITDTTNPTKIYYNKHYYNAPEVQVSVNSGTGSQTVTPYILRTDGMDNDKRYFEVELRNDSNERVAGYISWVSKGW